MPTLFCFGFSYTAQALVRQLAKEGADWEIAATSRGLAKPELIETSGQKVHLLPFGSSKSHEVLLDATAVLMSAPPTEAGDPVLAAFKETLPKATPTWLAYLSTTGPYGDCGGAWVDEEAPLNPSGPRAQRRIAAERAWQVLAEERQLPLHIFRLPGLYGPGRSAFDRLREGTARRIVKPGQVFSRIHIDDLGKALNLSVANPNPRARSEPVLYNVADDCPAPPQDIVTYAAALLGITPPPEISFDEADLSPMARSFYADNKRISNRRIKKDLGFTLAYPSYKEGLRAILESEKAQGKND